MEKIRGLQALRGIAACAVVYSHSYSRAVRAWPEPSFIEPHGAIAQLGHVGVDLFFVLSGFLMTYLHHEYFGVHGIYSEFLRKRIQRIVPLYWLLTILGLLILAVAPSLFTYHKGIEWGWTLGNFAFVPWPMSDGFYDPVVGTAWTLDYEMYFYVLFAIALSFRKGLTVLVAFLLASFAVGLSVHFKHPWAALLTAPMLAEFLLGMVVALTWQWIPRKAAPFLLVLAIGTILVSAGTYTYAPKTQIEITRVWCWGIPSAITIAMLVKISPACQGPWGRLLTYMGDASYSIYLVQVFAIPAWAIVLRTVPGQVDLKVSILWVFSCGSGVLCWRLIERPLNRWVKMMTVHMHLAAQ